MIPIYETTDLAVAAWLRVHGLRLIKAGFRNGKRGAHFYCFEDPDQLAPDLVVEFANSPEAKFDQTVRALKKLVYEGRSPVI